jgi:hypothetical protein
MLLLRHSRFLDSEILVSLSIAEKGRTKAYIRIATVLQGFQAIISITPTHLPVEFLPRPDMGCSAAS